MFWIVSLIAGLGFVMAKVGAYSVWVTVLTVGVTVLAVLLLLIMVFVVWDKFIRRGGSRKELPFK